jgi:hypothetical protein
MNHKIYELAERAGAYCEVLRGGDYKPPDLTYMSLEKYTELIVRECAKIAIDCDVTEYNDFREGISQEIKQHFGVKS